MNMQQKQQQGYGSMEQEHHQTDSRPFNNCIGDGDGYTQNEQQQPLQHYNFSNTVTSTQDTSQNQYQTYYEGHPSSWPFSPSETTPPQDASRQLYSTSPAGETSPQNGQYSPNEGGVYASYGDGGGICSPCSPSSPLTREQQEMDTSYTMLMGQEASERNACIDGKIEEPHLHDV